MESSSNDSSTHYCTPGPLSGQMSRLIAAKAGEVYGDAKELAGDAVDKAAELAGDVKDKAGKAFGAAKGLFGKFGKKNK